MQKCRVFSFTGLAIAVVAALILMQALWVSMMVSQNRAHLREHISLVVYQYSDRLLPYLQRGERQQAEQRLRELIAQDLRRQASSLRFDLKLIVGLPHGVQENKHRIVMALPVDAGNPYYAVVNCNPTSWLTMGPVMVWALISLTFVSILVMLLLVFIQRQKKQKRLDKIKSDFVSNMTHELKTPIATISVASEMLMKSGSQVMDIPKIKRYSRIIADENSRLKRLVDTVLQLAIFEKGETIYRFTRLDLHQILREVMAKADLLASENSTMLSYDLRADQSHIEGDETHLSNVFLNILENAIKYGGHSTKVCIESYNIPGRVVIKIADDGPGVPEELKERIFEQFSRGGSGNVHNVKGFGLGLYYVRKVLDAHGADITIEDRQPHGAVFVLTFSL